MIMNIGFTPICHMSSALTIGIQQFVIVMPALFARLNVGAAMSATTAG